MKVSKYFKIKKIPGIIKKLTGVSVEKFEDLLKQLTPLFIEVEKKRLFKKSRKRAFGGGRKQDLDLDDKLLMLLMYNHLFVTHEFLGALFNLHNSNVSRQINHLEPLLSKVFQVPERKIKLADSVLSQSQILEIFVSLDDAEKKEMNYSPIGTDYPPMKSTGTGGTDLRISDDKIITKIKVIPIKKSEQNL
jgi:hypothetical protein